MREIEGNESNGGIEYYSDIFERKIDENNESSFAYDSVFYSFQLSVL